MKDLNDVEEGSKVKPDGNKAKAEVSEPMTTATAPTRSDAPSVMTTNMTSRSTGSNSASVLVTIDPSILALVTAVDNSDNEEDEIEPKAHLYFGLCCDLRRACIIVDIIQIILIVAITLLVRLDPESSVIGFIPAQEMTNVDDDLAADYDREFIQTTVRRVGGILFSVIGILGACLFNRWLVICAGTWCCIAVVFALMSKGWTGAIAAALFAYAHIAMFMELRRGKITKENYYARESACFPRCAR